MKTLRVSVCVSLFFLQKTFGMSCVTTIDATFSPENQTSSSLCACKYPSCVSALERDTKSVTGDGWTALLHTSSTNNAVIMLKLGFLVRPSHSRESSSRP